MIVLSDENIVDSYSERVMLSGGAMDLDRYTKNPVLLFEHESYRMPIGRLEGLQIRGGQLIADKIEFDSDDEFAKDVERKYKKGMLNAFSIGFRAMEHTQLDKLEGQRGDTITKSELYEVSIVVIPSNKNSVAPPTLRKAGIELTKKIFSQINPQTKMELLLKKMGLTAQASEAEAVQKLVELETALQTRNAQVSELEAKISEIQDSQKKANAKMLVKSAIEAGKITAAQEELYLKLAENDFETTQAVLDSIQPYVSIKSQLAAQTSTKLETRSDWSFTDWQKKDSSGLAELREKSPEAYKELLKTLKQ